MQQLLKGAQVGRMEGSHVMDKYSCQDIQSLSNATHLQLHACLVTKAKIEFTMG